MTLLKEKLAVCHRPKLPGESPRGAWASQCALHPSLWATHQTQEQAQCKSTPHRVYSPDDELRMPTYAELSTVNTCNNWMCLGTTPGSWHVILGDIFNQLTSLFKPVPKSSLLNLFFEAIIRTKILPHKYS